MFQDWRGARMHIGVRFTDPRVAHVLDGETMGTHWMVTLVAPPGFALEPVRCAVESVLARVVAQMSHWDPDSDLSRFNRSGDHAEVVLPEDLARVLDAALTLAGETGGAFDPAVGALVALWGFGPRGTGPRATLPSAAEVARARGLGGWQRVRFDPGTRRASQPGGVELDFSGIAKGYAVDCVARALGALGIADTLVEIGGELRATGSRPDGRPWQVALATPASLRAERPPVVRLLSGRAIASSGDLWRAWELGGRRYSHTIDPRSGWPVPDTVAAVSVVHDECMHADALATALSVLGAEEGLAYARRNRLCAAFALRDPQGGESLRMTDEFRELSK